MKFSDIVVDSLDSRLKTTATKTKWKGHLVKTIDVEDCSESFFSEIDEQAIDEKNHTIKQVCIMGTRHSKNGYSYQDKAIETLAMMSNGAKFFINHPSKSESKDRDGVRDIRDWAGTFSNATRHEDKVYADVTIRPAFWELVKDVAVMKPAGVGNSLNARVKVYKDGNGQESVVDIDHLKSVDLVASAATTRSLFESTIEDIKEKKNREIEDFVEEGGLTLTFISDFVEGLLADKIKEREVARQVNKLTWEASDLIDEIIRDSKIKMEDKKKNVMSILDDLEVEINNIIAGKGKIKESDANDKEEEMDFGKLTISDLTKERPDIIDAIKNSIEGAEKMKGLEEENTTLKKTNEEMTTKLSDLQKSFDELKKENEDMKKKLDEFETKDKSAKKEAFIKEKIEEHKLSKEALSDVFMESLMSSDGEAIEKAIKDRKELWLKRTGKVDGMGNERDLSEGNKVTEEKKKETKEKFKSSIK